ncbi:MAG: DUF551 domain-containing protein [Patescibacteria group bacterium]|jgi:hypothetical protein
MKWISIKDRMPKDYQRVLATDGKGYDFLHLSNEFGFMEQPTGVKFWCPDNIHCSPKVNVNKITHWMEVELPEKPPKPLTAKQLTSLRKSMEQSTKIAHRILNKEKKKK